MATAIIIKGNQASMGIAISRLGADIIVVPEGTENKVETAILSGKPATVWMSEDKLAQVAAIPGVAAVSPQIFLHSLSASCCSVSNVFLVVFDPSTDFTLRPWFDTNLENGLKTGEVIGGSYISADVAHHIELYGYQVTLVGNLQPTGTGTDESIFMTYDTAEAIAESSLTTAQSPLSIPTGEISTIMVKTSPDADPHQVAQEIAASVSGVVPIESPSMFDSFQRQITGLLQELLYAEAIFLIFACILIGIFFATATGKRQREVAVLRAMGANRTFIFISLIGESAILALSGCLLGIVLASFIVSIYASFLSASVGIPFMFPHFSTWLLLAGTAILVILAAVILAVVIPAYRISWHEPALAARE